MKNLKSFAFLLLLGVSLCACNGTNSSSSESSSKSSETPSSSESTSSESSSETSFSSESSSSESSSESSSSSSSSSTPEELTPEDYLPKTVIYYDENHNPYNKSEYTYDENGNNTIQLDYDYDSEKKEWFYANRYTMTYSSEVIAQSDVNPFEYDSYLSEKYDRATGKWSYSAKETYTLVNETTIEDVQYYYDETKSDWAPRLKDVYTIDSQYRTIQRYSYTCGGGKDYLMNDISTTYCEYGILERTKRVYDVQLSILKTTTKDSYEYFSARHYKKTSNSVEADGLKFLSSEEVEYDSDDRLKSSKTINGDNVLVREQTGYYEDGQYRLESINYDKNHNVVAKEIMRETRSTTEVTEELYLVDVATNVEELIMKTYSEYDEYGRKVLDEEYYYDEDVQEVVYGGGFIQQY